VSAVIQEWAAGGAERAGKVVMMAGPRGPRAQKAALRERIRAAGMGHDRVADELGRRFQLRPRAAWREANGWSLTEAAAQINEHAGRSGLDPAGTASMTGPHLSEYETWPGLAADGGPMTGRRPRPYLLALLARVYGCGVDDLVDVADRENMPPADLLLIDELGRPGVAAGTGRPGSAVAVRDAATAVTTAGRGLAAGGALPAQPDNPGSGGLSALPGVAYVGIWEPAHRGRSWAEREVIAMADAGDQRAQRAEERTVGDTTLEQIRADIERLARARDSGTAELFPLLLDMQNVRGRVDAALDQRIWPRDMAELTFDAALINYQMAIAAGDLGYPLPAEKMLHAAWTYAMVLDHRPLMARLRGEAAAVAYWDGRPRQAQDYAARALSYCSEGRHGALFNLVGAWAAAALGDADATRRAIADASAAHERDYTDELLEMGGAWGISWATQHYCAGSALLVLPSGASEAAAELELAIEQYTAGPRDGEQHNDTMRMGTHADLGTARLRAGDLDAAIESLELVLALPPASRTDQIAKRLQTGVRRELAAQRYQNSPQATELDERVEEFSRATIVAALHDLPGGIG
jgi:tetratricopeptide (TPR) repeat protein